MIEYVQMGEAHVPQIAQLEKICFCDPWCENSIATELSNRLSYWLVAVGMLMNGFDILQRRLGGFESWLAEEKLKEEETRKYIDNAFRDGGIKTTGTDIDKLMPPVSRCGGGNRANKKQGIIDKLMAFFEKYFGIV